MEDHAANGHRTGKRGNRFVGEFYRFGLRRARVSRDVVMVFVN